MECGGKCQQILQKNLFLLIFSLLLYTGEQEEGGEERNGIVTVALAPSFPPPPLNGSEQQLRMEALPCSGSVGIPPISQGGREKIQPVLKRRLLHPS